MEQNFVAFDDISRIIKNYCEGCNQVKRLAVWMDERPGKKTNVNLSGLHDWLTEYLEDFEGAKFINSFTYLKDPIGWHEMKTLEQVVEDINKLSLKPKFLAFALYEVVHSSNEAMLDFGMKLNDMTGIPVVFFLNNIYRSKLDNKLLNYCEQVFCID